jgi:AcrR family transcriptional regulator
MIDQLTEQLTDLYPDIITGKDLQEIARRTDISRFTVWQYFIGKGKNATTAGEILREALQIHEQRQTDLEKAEIINETFKNQ